MAPAFTVLYWSLYSDLQTPPGPGRSWNPWLQEQTGPPGVGEHFWEQGGGEERQGARGLQEPSE